MAEILRERDAHPETYLTADLEFHRSVAHAAHNLLLEHVFDSLQEVVVGWLATVINQAEHGKPQSFSEHERIFEAIADRNAADARTAMAAHLAAAGSRLLTVVPVASDGEV